MYYSIVILVDARVGIYVWSLLCTPSYTYVNIEMQTSLLEKQRRGANKSTNNTSQDLLLAPATTEQEFHVWI